MRLVLRSLAACWLAVGLAAAPLLAPEAARADEKAPSAQQRFASPEDGAAALVAAAKKDDRGTLLQILGPEASDLLDSGDPVQDRTALDRFVKSYEAAHSFDRSGEGEGVVVLVTGKDEWPLPIPLVEDDGKWRFDTAAGEEELLSRRIGRNELAAIEVCREYASAQHEYYRRNPEADPLPHYASKVASSPDKHDGLYWPPKGDESPSPLGPLIARARGEGYAEAGKKAIPYHGYLYKILTAQGPNAPGGAYDYMAGDKMIGGFALVAYPAEYDVSGVMTFLVNHDEVLFQKDLGPDTAKAVADMKTFDPDETWERVTPEE